eukprot:655841-Amphidinium_carterae.1
MCIRDRSKEGAMAFACSAPVSSGSDPLLPLGQSVCLLPQQAHYSCTNESGFAPSLVGGTWCQDNFM